MKKLSLFIATVLFFAGATVINAQDNNDTNEAGHAVAITIPTVALVDVEDGTNEANSINLSPTITGLDAGQEVEFSAATNSSFYLNYTSIVASEQTRDIRVQLSESTLPTGVTIVLSASESAIGGKGTKGTGVSDITLETASAKDIVTGIGSCYTGTGIKGHQLTYKLAFNDDNYASLLAGSYGATVTYTITGE